MSNNKPGAGDPLTKMVSRLFEIFAGKIGILHNSLKVVYTFKGKIAQKI